MPHSERIRITISLSKEVSDRIDETVDGIAIRNRSHAIENLIIESLHLAPIRQAVVLIGGENATKRLPAIRSMLKTLAEAGVAEIIMAVGFLGDKIRQELGSGADFGVRISYHQTELGTGGALAELKDRLKQTFLAVNLSESVTVDVQDILAFHREHGPLITIASTSLTSLDGVYVIEPEALQTIPKGFCMLEDTVFPELTKQGKLLSYPVLTPLRP